MREQPVRLCRAKGWQSGKGGLRKPVDSRLAQSFWNVHDSQIQGRVFLDANLSLVQQLLAPLELIVFVAPQAFEILEMGQQPGSRSSSRRYRLAAICG